MRVRTSADAKVNVISLHMTDGASFAVNLNMNFQQPFVDSVHRIFRNPQFLDEDGFALQCVLAIPPMFLSSPRSHPSSFASIPRVHRRHKIFRRKFDLRSRVSIIHHVTDAHPKQLMRCDRKQYFMAHLKCRIERSSDSDLTRCFFFSDHKRIHAMNDFLHVRSVSADDCNIAEPEMIC